MKYPTVKMLNETPLGTVLSIDLKINGKWDSMESLIKTDENKWESVYANGVVRVNNIPKLIESFIKKNEECIITLNPNGVHDGDKPIRIFNQGSYYTENNTRMLKGYETVISKKHQPSCMCYLENSVRKMF